MPERIPRNCGEPGCPEPALRGGRCAEHRRLADASRNDRRAQSLAVYRSKRWRQLRRAVLRDRPTCEWREQRCFAIPTEVDHIVRIEDGGDPWDEANLQALCHDHHSEKTARETGFGGRHE